MSIAVTCQCGKSFAANENLAGKNVKCPSCNSPLSIPNPNVSSAAPQQTIVVSCQCGQQFQAPIHMAGKQVPCPVCGTTLAIAERSTSPSPQFGPAAATPAPLASQPTGVASDNPIANQAVQPIVNNPVQAPVANPTWAQPSPVRSKFNSKLIIHIACGAVGLTVVLIGIIFGVRVLLRATNGIDSGTESTTGFNVVVQRETSDAYPRFSNALIQKPVIEGAPFKLGEFFQNVASQDNAAPQYLEGLLEFNPEVSSCFPNAVRQREAAIQTRNARLQELYSKWKIKSSQSDSNAIEALMNELGDGFEKIRNAQSRPRCVFQPGMDQYSLYPHMAAVRDYAIASSLKVDTQLMHNQIDDAIEQVRVALRLGRDIGPRGPLIAQLVSASVDRRCFEHMIVPILHHSSITVQQCDKLLAVLDRHREQVVDRYTTSLLGDYVMMRILHHDVHFETGSFDTNYFNMYFANSLELPIQPQPTSLGDKVAVFLINITGMPYKREAQAERLDGIFATRTDSSYAAQISYLNDIYTKMLALRGSPYQEQLASAKGIMQELHNKSDDFYLMRVLIPDLVSTINALFHTRTSHNATKCRLALRRWQLEHADVPDDLATIVKAAGMDAIPEDEFAGKPLRMLLVNGSPIIYSIGGDGEDNGGHVDAQDDPGHDGDLLYRMYRK